MNQRALLLALVTILAIWGGVLLVMRVTESHTSNPQKVVNVMSEAPWLTDPSAQVTEAQRKEHIGKVIAQVNLLDYQQRQAMREYEDQEGRRFFESLSQEEKSRFLQETVEQHFKSVMKAFNKMQPEERRKLVRQARQNMERNRVEGQDMERLKAEDEKVFENLVEKGLSAYYQDANSDTKMDLAPLMEEMQLRLRNLPGR